MLLESLRLKLDHDLPHLKSEVDQYEHGQSISDAVHVSCTIVDIDVTWHVVRIRGIEHASSVDKGQDYSRIKEPLKKDEEIACDIDVQWFVYLFQSYCSHY